MDDREAIDAELRRQVALADDRRQLLSVLARHIGTHSAELYERLK